MKRLIPMSAAIVALAGSLALGDVAAAKDQHGGGDRGGHSSDRGGDRGGRGADQGDRGGRGADQGGRGGEYRGDRGGYERRGGDERGVYRDRGGPPPGWREDRGGQGRGDRRVYEPEGPPPPYNAPSARRGGYVPPQAGGAVPDYGRYRLRPPPRGFVWVRTANGYAMVSQDTGRVFDVVPY